VSSDPGRRGGPDFTPGRCEIFMLVSSSIHLGGITSWSMEDATRFALALISMPIVVVASGLVIGLIGRWVTGRRDG